MTFLCSLGRHRAKPAQVWNNGYLFSACARCGCDLVRRPQSRWKSVPSGYKVVWKPRPPGYPNWKLESGGLERAGLAALLVDEPQRQKRARPRNNRR